MPAGDKVGHRGDARASRSCCRSSCCCGTRERRSPPRHGTYTLRRRVKVAGLQHDIVWEDRDANFERLAPMIAGAAADGARLVVLTEMFSTGFSMAVDRVAEARDGPSAQFLAAQARAARRVGVRVVPRTARRRRAAVQPTRARRARRHAASLRQDPSVRLRRRARALRGRRRVPHRRHRRRSLHVLRLLRPALRRRVLAARAAHRLLRGGRELAPATARALVGAAARPGDREPGVRGRREPGRHRRRPHLRRRLGDPRSARGAGRGGRRRRSA